MSVYNKILRNTLSSTASKSFHIVTLFIITPLVLKYLGSERYGLWGLIFSLSGYIQILDFSVKQSYAPFIAEHYAKNEILEINKILCAGLLFYIGIAVLAVIIMYFGLDIIVYDLLKIPFKYGTVAKNCIFLAFVVMCISNIFDCFTGLLEGMQRMDVTSGIEIISRIISVCGTLLVINKDLGLLGLTVNACLAILIKALLTAIASLLLFPRIRLTMGLIDKKYLSKLFKYGFSIQTIALAPKIVGGLMLIAISNLLGLTYVAYFTLATKCIYFIRMFPDFLFKAIIPAAAELNAANKKEHIVRFYYDSSKYISFFSFYMMCCIASALKYLIYIWLGSSPDEVVYLIYAFLISGAIQTALSGMGGAVLRGIGMPKYEVKKSLLYFVIALPFSIFFLRVFGFMGIAYAFFIAVVASTFYFYFMFHKLYNTRPGAMLRDVFLLPFITGLGLFIATQFMSAVFDLKTTSILGNLFYALLVVSIFTGVYFSVCYMFKYFSKNEIIIIFLRVKNIFSKKRMVFAD